MITLTMIFVDKVHQSKIKADQFTAGYWSLQYEIVFS